METMLMFGERVFDAEPGSVGDLLAQAVVSDRPVKSNMRKRLVRSPRPSNDDMTRCLLIIYAA